MRRGNAIGLTLASGVALVGGWLLGHDHSTSPITLASPIAPSSAATGTSSPTSSHTSSAAEADRTFTGAAERTQYGTVQVQAVFASGKLVNVVPLHLTDRERRSVSISAYAAPILRREALASASARIHAVSGASFTSAGYIASLQSALDAARAAGLPS